jgi:coenzyme Q-binding protein COQ10
LPTARNEVVVGVPPDRLWDVIVDWDRYPEFLPELKEVVVHRAAHDGYDVTFEVSLIKRIRYRLRFRADPPHTLAWEMVEGNLLTRNSGAWTLRAEGAEGGATRAVYEVDIEVGQYVPRAILTKLVTVSLPRMLAQFKERAEAAAS